MINNILNFTKKHIKKAIFLLSTFFVIWVYASSNNWWFDLLSDYTYSNSLSFTVTGSVASINQVTLAHTWVITNATNYNWAYDVVVEWSYAYMTSYLWNRVTILNISNPSAPTLVWSIIDNWWTIRLAWASWIVKEGNYLYVTSYTWNAVQIINVTNPAAPTAAGQVYNATTLAWARWITKVWNYLYVAVFTYDALQVVDVTNPASPSIVWTYRQTTNMNWASEIKISGNYAYVSAYNRDALSVINISTPTTPTYVTQLRDSTNLNWARDIAISWNYVYVSAYLNNSVRVIDISNPTAPVAVTNISWWSYSINWPRDLDVDNNRLFIAWYTSNAINVADISNPTIPIYVTKILHNAANPLLSWADWLFKIWDLIYVASYTSDALEILRFMYDTTSPYLSPATSFDYGVSQSLLSFTEILWAWNQWTITYQISKNNWTTWYYLNWTTRTATTWWVANSTSATSINSNLTTFNALGWWTGLFTFKAFFTSNWTQKVELDAITVTSTSPPTPGWVSTNLSIWLKANKWTSTTTDLAALTSWADQSWNWYDAWWWVSPTYLNNTTTWNINFNPYVNFDWSQYLENLNNWWNSKSYFIVVVPNNQIDWTVAGQVPFAWDCNSWILSSWTCWLSFAWGVLGAFTVAMNDEVITHALWSSVNRRSAQIWAYSYEANRPMFMWFNENSSADGTDIYEKWLKIDNFVANTYQTLTTADYRIWMTLDWANPFPYNWKIAEIINYSSRVSDIDRQKIESYLALKYGITLNWWTQNYIASDWTTLMWSTWSDLTFINGIFGVWRDDWSDFGQVKSRSMNSDWIITLTALWEWTNMTPTYVDIANKEFFTISNDAWWNAWTSIWAPTWYDLLVRKWKIQEVGDVWTVSLDFDVANSWFDVPLLSTGSNYYFIYDSNINGSLSDETPLVMTNTSWTIWQISGINLSNLQRFTLVSLTSSNNIPTNITLSNNTINENVASWSTIWIITTTDADLWDIHTYSFVTGFWDTDNWSFTLSWNILKINESPDYEIKSNYTVRIQTNDWHWWLYQKQFDIFINNIWETINSIIDFETPGKYTVTSWNWSRLTTNPYEKLYSIESNNWWLPNTQSCFEITNTFIATWTVEFYYNVSSQAGADFLRFYIDNVEQQAWSGTVPWTLYSKNNVAAWTHSYKWCYIKDWATNTWNDNAFIDYVTYADSAIDSIPPKITSINYASWYLLPWWNHNLIINYNDAETGINTSTDIIALYKWDWVSWWANISTTWLNLTWKTITATVATYPTNNLVFWKYMYNFQISDNSGNSASTWAVFYIDQPEIIVSTWSFNIWTLTWTWLNFSTNEIIVTIKTVWASFQVEVLKDTDLLTWGGSIIIDWDGSKWVWYDKNPYTLVNKNINSNPIIWTWVTNININWVKNIYNFPIKIGTLINLEQAAGTYNMSLSFRSIFGY